MNRLKYQILFSLKKKKKKKKKKINKSSAAVVISILRVEHTRINPFIPEIQKCILLTLNLGESIVSNRDVGNK